MINTVVDDGHTIDLPTLLDMSSDVFAIIDHDRKIVFHHLKNQYPIFMEPLVQKGHSLLNVVNPQLVDLVARIIDQIQMSKLPYQSETEYRSDIGRMIYLFIKCFPVFIPGKDQFYIYIMVYDISPQKVFEKKLITEAKNIKILVEEANAMVIGLDARGYITDWNAHCKKITGFTRNEAYTQKFSSLLLPADQKALFRMLPDRIISNQMISNQEIVIQRKDGQRLTILFNGTPRVNTLGEIVGAIFIGQDVTELMEYRKSLEDTVRERTEELLRALKKEREVVEMKNRFVSIASHEFRTPLSTIQAASHFIKQRKNKISRNEVDNRLNVIEEQVRHMTSLLDDVLLYGKADAGKIQLFLTRINLIAFMSQVIAQIEESTGRTHVVHKSFKALPDEICTDEKLLRSILTNLLSNAIKYSPGKKWISIYASYSNNCLTVSIRDEGIGISPNDRNKIFEPFLRGKDSAHIEGTGLGLSIVKKAIELLNGHIDVESKLNMGSLFTVTIPDQIK